MTDALMKNTKKKQSTCDIIDIGDLHKFRNLKKDKEHECSLGDAFSEREEKLRERKW